MSDIEETTIETAIETEGGNIEKYLIFSIFGRQYAFQSRLISEITMFDAVYPLPLLPSYILGVINRYSIPYALFDIGLLLFNTPSPRGKVLVFKDNIDRIAFLIDDVSGIADIPNEDLLDIERDKRSEDITEAVSASFAWNNTNVLVLAIQRVLNHVSNGEKF